MTEDEKKHLLAYIQQLVGARADLEYQIIQLKARITSLEAVKPESQ